ncbi:MAG TPA: serine--tRNA ligase [Acidimicrobiia bacterium]|nr:serine--tRNA ligase [Acidimicrobiia bacterium]
MLDVALLRNEPDRLTDSLRRRGLDVDIDALIALDEERRAARAKAEEIRAQQNRMGKEISQLAGDEKEKAIGEATFLAENYKFTLARAEDLDEQFEALWVPLPNLVHESVPIGADEDENVELSRWGEPPEFDFEAKDHLDLGQALGIIDVERAAKVSGSRFGYLLGKAALMEFGLVQWAMGRLAAEGFTPVIPPVLVRDTALFGTGFFPGAREQVYAVGSSEPGHEQIDSDDLYLVGTAEVPLAGMHLDEILEPDELPIRYAGFSTCFRREAGTYGKDTRGIFRVHQFDKVEMFSFVRPEDSWDEHDRLLAIEESMVQELEIPYRVVTVATGDLGDSAAKKYDIEAWFPGQGEYREITSCSNTTDYQARRLGIRHRTDSGTETVHTLNGTAVAIGRTIAAILENFQQEDGSVIVPGVLRAAVGAERLDP